MNLSLRTTAKCEQSALLSWLHKKCCSCCSLKYFPNALIRDCTALDILIGANLLTYFLALLSQDGLLSCSGQFFDRLHIVAEVALASNENDGQAFAEVEDFTDPLSITLVAELWNNLPKEIRAVSCTLSRLSGESMAKQMRIT
jgi:hypothetical protein